MALADYLASRREEIEGHIKALKAELNEIRIAEAALSGTAGGRTVVASPHGPAVVRAGTIKDWVLKALSHFETGLETDAVIEAVRKMGGPIVSRSSMTPQLSRLKTSALISHDGRHWRLSSLGRAQNDEASGGGTPDASEDDDLSDIA